MVNGYLILNEASMQMVPIPPPAEAEDGAPWTSKGTCSSWGDFRASGASSVSESRIKNLFVHPAL